MPKIEKICKNPVCNKKFKTREADIKKGWGKYCSRSCATSHNNKMKATPKIPNKKCAYCGSSIFVGNNRIKVSKHQIFFCCRKHKDKFYPEKITKKGQKTRSSCKSMLHNNIRLDFQKKINTFEHL